MSPIFSSILLFLFICGGFCLDFTSESWEDESMKTIRGFPQLSEAARWSGGYKKCKTDTLEIKKATKFTVKEINKKEPELKHHYKLSQVLTAWRQPLAYGVAFKLLLDLKIVGSTIIEQHLVEVWEPYKKTYPMLLASHKIETERNEIAEAIDMMQKSVL